MDSRSPPKRTLNLGHTLRTVLYEDPAQRLPVPDFAADFQLTVGELVAWLYE